MNKAKHQTGQAPQKSGFFPIQKDLVERLTREAETRAAADGSQNANQAPGAKNLAA